MPSTKSPPFVPSQGVNQLFSDCDWTILKPSMHNTGYHSFISPSKAPRAQEEIQSVTNSLCPQQKQFLKEKATLDSEAGN